MILPVRVFFTFLSAFSFLFSFPFSAESALVETGRINHEKNWSLFAGWLLPFARVVGSHREGFGGLSVYRQIFWVFALFFFCLSLILFLGFLSFSSRFFRVITHTARLSTSRLVRGWKALTTLFHFAFWLARDERCESEDVFLVCLPFGRVTHDDAHPRIDISAQAKIFHNFQCEHGGFGTVSESRPMRRAK